MKRQRPDHPRSPESSGMAQAMTRIARNQLPRVETLALQRRPVTRPLGARLREFARIARGHMA
jgi:hypothetical protein